MAALIHTDIDRDGMLAGLNVSAALKLASIVSVPVIVGGGLASIADVRAFSSPTAGGSQARSPGGPSTMAGSMPGKHCGSSAKIAKGGLRC